MSSMTSPGRIVMSGVDAHTDTHDAAALDERGRLLATRTFPTSPEGNRALLAWLESFGSVALIGVESTGSYAAGLVQFLRSRDVAVDGGCTPASRVRRIKTSWGVGEYDFQDTDDRVATPFGMLPGRLQRPGRSQLRMPAHWGPPPRPSANSIPAGIRSRSRGSAIRLRRLAGRSAAGIVACS
jgi:hypothetical protein